MKECFITTEAFPLSLLAFKIFTINSVNDIRLVIFIYSRFKISETIFEKMIRLVCSFVYVFLVYC